MRIKYITLLLFAAFSMQLFSKDKTTVKEVSLVSNYSIQMPMLIDSTDVNGSKYDTKQMLVAFVPSTASDYTTYPVLSADTAGLFHLVKPENGSELCYVEFQVYANRYTKSKLRVASTSEFVIFINGEKKEGSTTSELALPKATEKSVELNLIPQNYSIGICCLLNSKDEAASVLKVALADEDSRIVQMPLDKASQRKISYEDIINYSAPTDVSISYNGTFMMTKVTTVVPGGTTTSSLEITDRETGECMMQRSDRMDLSWMPKSEKLYYMDQTAGVRTLKTIDPMTNEVKTVAKNIPEGYVTWSPDETYLILSSTDKYNGKEKDIKYYILPHDRLSGFRNGSYLSRYDLATGKVQRLTFGRRDVSLQDISEDGKKILFSTSESAITERPFSKSSFFQYDFANQTIDSIWVNCSYVSSVKYSPDATQLLVLGAPEAFNKLGENIGKHPISNSYDVQAYLYDFASKKVTPLTRHFDPAIQQAQWNAADKNIYFKVTDRDYERIYRYTVANGSFEMLPLAVDVVQQVDISSNGLYAVYRGMTASYPSRAFVLNMKSKESVVLSDPEKEKMNGIAFGKVLDYNYKAKDGVTIYGRYYLPNDFDENKKYPMIVYYYGGTTPTQRTFSTNWNHNYWTALGYVVYVVQPSGTIGFGQEFSARHVNAWGEQTADDIIQGVKNFCKSHSFVNAKKVGCLGASYGGFMTMYLLTKTNIFATAISHAGISALSSYWGNGNWGYGYSGVATADTYPWNNPKFYTDHSPLFHADKINTPLLLIQGEMDTNVPPGESMQMFTALKILGKPVEMIRVKNEDHIITEYQHKKDWNYSIMAWMARYLQDDSSWWDSLYPESSTAVK